MAHKVVIIDDEPWTRGVILKLGQWNQLGLEVVGEAADGETGLELIYKVLPDIIITDVRMPRIGGLELVQKLREQGYNVPVLIVSGYDDFSYVRSALQLGVTDYILKPVKAQELNQQLQNCVKALEKIESAKPKTMMQASFFADGWEDMYSEIRKKLESALYVGNSEIIEKQFGQLQQVICKHEGENPSTTVLIGIYYALLYPLQKYIDTIGVNKEDAFGMKAPVFVFRRDNTPDQILAFVKELYLGVLQYVEKQQQQRARLDIDAVCRYIKENYTQGITLEQTADIFHVSKEYLSKAFKAHMNEGFAEYVTALRMKRAYELITDYHAQLKDVGAMVGYYDLAHFYKTFKKYYGKTPGEVRDSLKIDNTRTP